MTIRTRLTLWYTAILFAILVVIALIWSWIFNPEIGVVNHALLAGGLITERIYWLFRDLTEQESAAAAAAASGGAEGDEGHEAGAARHQSESVLQRQDAR